jgi:hypothetical protein
MRARERALAGRMREVSDKAHALGDLMHAAAEALERNG